MEIVSWNVNGLRAALNNGLSSFIDESNADIYAFQESKVGDDVLFKKDGYLSYASYSKEKCGYSGTLCLTKKKPISVRYDIGNDEGFDIEGRIITLEFEDFFFVNCYFPNTKRSNERIDYRAEWDYLILKHLNNLRQQKPTIACGDFNVNLSEDDERSKFESIEKENIKNLLDSGFIDSYKLLHPNEKGKYTWWSTRNKDRKKKGRRLDYFFVSQNLIRALEESTMLMDVFGSDHCPIILDIDLTKIKKVKKNKFVSNITYDEIIELEKSGVSLEELKSADLTKAWSTINFDKAEKHLEEMQKEIAIHAKNKDYKKMMEAENKLVSSIDAKILAVKRVADNKKQAGIDKEVWETSHEKMLGVVSLTKDNYKAMPNIMVNLTCKNGKKRHIQKGTYYDTSMQCLYSFALDPISEAWGDKKSFAYRKLRSSIDVDYYIKKALTGKDAPKYLFKADVEKCYEKIIHSWIEKNIPLDKDVLKIFLEEGYIYEGELFEKDEGIGIGCPLSPIIANMTLDGLEEYVYKKLYPLENRIDYKKFDMIRFADDVLFVTESEEHAKRIKIYMAEFLKDRGLNLSKEKSKTFCVDEGFEFVGRYYFKKDDILRSKPSKNAITKIKDEMEELIDNYNGSQETLIKTINKKIDGWVSFNKYTEAKEAFEEIDEYIYSLLLRMCKRRENKIDNQKIILKYWIKDEYGRYRFALKDKKTIKVKLLKDTILVKQFYPLPLNINPYIDRDYSENIKKEKEIANVVGKYRTIWNHNNGKCYYCGKDILIDEERTLIDLDLKSKILTERYAYVHKRCLDTNVEFIDVDVLPSSNEELEEILGSYLNDKKKKELNSKYGKLYKFFNEHKEAKDDITLSFNKIEEILGSKLSKESLKEDFWFKVNDISISHAWLDNGFKIKTLSYKPYPRIIFSKSINNKKLTNIVLPDTIKNNVFPKKAIYEANEFFKYLIAKYLHVSK